MPQLTLSSVPTSPLLGGLKCAQGVPAAPHREQQHWVGGRGETGRGLKDPIWQLKLRASMRSLGLSGNPIGGAGTKAEEKEPFFIL